ncbi:MAG TPA: 16S rRNA (uracil(1498)-N(3))-methyltransferase [Steroidobacteraceae bacterium]|nr:16S rRNA (uracil(1498)-N(3))-methyltransferase [Steroidobacteraceae bacterium]
MRLTRVYLDAPLSAGARVTLAGSAARHVTRVLRLRPGQALVLFNGGGGEYAATIEAVQGEKVVVAVGDARAIERESPLSLTLAQGVSRGERMDLVVQKATELGASRIVPVLTERSVVRLSAPEGRRKVEHWRAIVIAACEQSGRNRLPRLAPPLALADFLRSPESARYAAGDVGAGGTIRLLLSPAAAPRLDEVPGRGDALTVLIGPEGGLSEAEEQAALDAGFTAVHLGPRVLRTETAAIAALTLLQRRFGDL